MQRARLSMGITRQSTTYCWHVTLFFFLFPRRNRLTPCCLTMHSFLHDHMDFKDFPCVGRGDNAPQVDGLQDEQLTTAHQAHPPALLSSLSPLLPPCNSVLTISKVPPTWNPAGQGHREISVLRDGLETREMNFSVCFCGSLASGKFLFFYYFFLIFFPCTSLTLPLINLCRVCGKMLSSVCKNLCVSADTNPGCSSLAVLA